MSLVVIAARIVWVFSIDFLLKVGRIPLRCGEPRAVVAYATQAGFHSASA